MAEIFWFQFFDTNLSTGMNSSIFHIYELVCTINTTELLCFLLDEGYFNKPREEWTSICFGTASRCSSFSETIMQPSLPTPPWQNEAIQRQPDVFQDSNISMIVLHSGLVFSEVDVYGDWMIWSKLRNQSNESSSVILTKYFFYNFTCPPG